MRMSGPKVANSTSEDNMTPTPFQKMPAPGALVGSTEELIALLFGIPQDEHVRDYRWHLFRQGITVDRFGNKRSSRTGELI